MGTWILMVSYDLQGRYFMIWFIVRFYFTVVPSGSFELVLSSTPLQPFRPVLS